MKEDITGRITEMSTGTVSGMTGKMNTVLAPLLLFFRRFRRRVKYKRSAGGNCSPVCGVEESYMTTFIF